MNQTQSKQITELNDKFRKQELSSDRLTLSPKVEALPENKKELLINAVSNVDYFVEGDSSHDLGLVTVEDTYYLWEIDYYDKNLRSSSPNPADPNCTTRVLTILRMDEY